MQHSVHSQANHYTKMSKIKPILFQTDMVNAILNGTKTQTRRAIKSKEPLLSYEGEMHNRNFAFWKEGMLGNHIFMTEDSEFIVKPKFQIGDVMWVRETWRLTDWMHPSDDNYGYIYKASKNGEEWERNDENWKWKPSIFMPKNACRVFLKVDNVRVEYLKDITEEDSKKEGVFYYGEESEDFRNYLFTWC